MPTSHMGRDTEAETLAVPIRRAWKAVEESGVPSQVQEVAFTEVLRSLLGTKSQRTSSAEQLEPLLSHAEIIDNKSITLDGASSSFPSEDDVVQKVCAEAGVDVEKLEQIFHVDDGVVKLIGQHTKYGSNTADRARTVAKIVTVVRKLGMGHSDTPFDVIKDACESKHCYDSKNFAPKHMPRIDGFVVKGEGKSRRLEVRNNGISAFPDLIDKVLGLA